MNGLLAAILSGAGQGLGQFGQAANSRRDRIAKQQELDLRREQQAQATRDASADRALRERQVQLQEREAEGVDLATFDQPGAKIPKFLLPMMEARRKEQAETAKLDALRTALGNYGKTAPTHATVGELTPGLESDEPMEGPRASNRMDLVQTGTRNVGPTREQVAGHAVGVPGSLDILKSLGILPSADETKFHSADPEHDVFAGTKLIRPGRPGATKTINLGPGHNAYDPISREKVIEGPPATERNATPGAAYVAAVDALEQAETQFGPNDSRTKAAAIRVDRLKPLIIPPGGAATGPTGSTHTAGPPLPTPPGERKELAGVDKHLSAVDRLLKGARDPNIIPALGTLFSNPQGAAKRYIDSWTGTALTPEQQGYIADLAFTAGEIRRDMVGLAQTVPELKNATKFLPSEGDPDQLIVSKLTAFRQLLIDNRGAIEAALRQQPNMVVPQRPGVPAGAAPAAPKVQKWGRDAQGNPVPVP